MGFVFESLILVGGLCYILFHFVRNSYLYNVAHAHAEMLFHFSGVWILIVTFGNVFIQGKEEYELLDH